MRLKIFTQNSSNVVAGYRLMKFFLVCMVVSQFVLGYIILSVVNSQRTIFVPPHIRDKAEITSYTANDAYIRAITTYFISLYFNYTPVNIRPQYEDLLTYYAPEAFNTAKSELYKLAGIVEGSKNITSTFYVHYPLIFDKKGSSVEIQGIRVIKSDLETKEMKKTYIMKYVIRDGMFYLLSIKEKGSDSRERGEDVHETNTQGENGGN